MFPQVLLLNRILLYVPTPSLRLLWMLNVSVLPDLWFFLIFTPRSDEILQKLVYKLVPALVSNEIRRRVEFVTSAKPAVVGGEEDEMAGEASAGTAIPEIQMIKETEDAVFLSPNDPVSLSLEYFKRWMNSYVLLLRPT